VTTSSSRFGLDRLPLPPLPTRVADWRLLARTARLVVSVPAYAAVALVAAAVGLTLFVGSQNLALVGDVVVGGSLPVSTRLTVLAELYPFVGTSYGPVTGGALVVVSAMIGVNVAMAVYHLREHELTAVEGGGSLAGVLLGTLGAGCAACGSAVLAGLLSLVGASGTLLLPFDGLEFTALAAVAVLLSSYWLADGMRGGEVAGCPVDL
jgi:hypothetical protein